MEQLTPDQAKAFQLAHAFLGYALRPDEDETQWKAITKAFYSELTSPRSMQLTALVLANYCTKFMGDNGKEILRGMVAERA